ncbi:MAG: hypothetical protein WCO60_15135 [Verrucomicrobiota bacterium]
MSVVCIITPIVVSSWPGFASTVLAAATSLGFREVTHAKDASVLSSQTGQRGVTLDIQNSDIVTNTLERDQRISVTKDGVTVTFARDPRGKASICVTGTGQPDTLLRTIGEELSNRVIQTHVHRRLVEEMNTRGYAIVEESTEPNQSIRLKVRHWEQ